jgi:hypothetical protein
MGKSASPWMRPTESSSLIRDPKKQGEILELCRTSVAALHDLHFLMKQITGDTAKMSEYIRISGEPIQKMTEVLCLK